jgi:hypothetical protein
MVNYWMLGLNAEPAGFCRGLTSAGLQSGSKEIASLMFFTFFCLFVRERQIAGRIAEEIAVSPRRQRNREWTRIKGEELNRSERRWILSRTQSASIRG